MAPIRRLRVAARASRRSRQLPTAKPMPTSVAGPATQAAGRLLGGLEDERRDRTTRAARLQRRSGRKAGLAPGTRSSRSTDCVRSRPFNRPRIARPGDTVECTCSAATNFTTEVTLESAPVDRAGSPSTRTSTRRTLHAPRGWLGRSTVPATARSERLKRHAKDWRSAHGPRLLEDVAHERRADRRR